MCNALASKIYIIHVLHVKLCTAIETKMQIGVLFERLKKIKISA